MTNVISISGAAQPDTRAIIGARGYMPTYHAHEVNHCPGCGRTHWLVGRLLAECAFCATALPLDGGGLTGAGLFRVHGKTWQTRPSDQLAA